MNLNKNIVILFSSLFFMSACQKKSNVQPAAPQKTEARTQPVTLITKSPTELAKAKVEFAPNYENWIDLGLTYEREQQPLKAKDCYLKALELKQNDPIVYNNLCWLHYSQGLLKEAEKQCKKAITLAPQFTLAINNLKAIEDKKMKLVKEKTRLESELSKIPTKDRTTQEKLTLDLGLNYYQQENYEVAQQIWRKIPKTSSFFALSLSNQASADILMKRFEAAEKKLNEAILLFPDDPLFKRNKEWLNEAKSAH